MNIEVRFTHRFPGFELDIAFAVERPGVTALFGPSGCGKTTIVNVIAGLLKPDKGEVRLNGSTVLDTTSGINVPAHKRRIGYVFQDARLFPHMSVRRNLDFGARRTGERLPDGEASAIITLLGLDNLLERKPRHLSGGERQRVALGRALLSNPAALLLDEPLAALDSGRKAGILPYLERIRDDARIPILYVSHSIDEVTRLANDIVVLNAGSVAATGPVEDIMSRLDLFPLTGRFEAGAVLEGHIARHLDNEDMSEIAVGENIFTVPRVAEEPGCALRLRVETRPEKLWVSSSSPAAVLPPSPEPSASPVASAVPPEPSTVSSPPVSSGGRGGVPTVRLTTRPRPRVCSSNSSIVRSMITSSAASSS